MRCFEDKGAIMIPIAHNQDRIDTYLDMIDGLVITGGDFDHDPSFYNEAPHPKTVRNSKRSSFDIELTKKALEKDIPFFGICAGMQALNIVRGGTLFQYIPEDLPHARNHQQEECRQVAVHDLDVKENTLLYKCNQNQTHNLTNTSHRQCINKVGQNLIVSGLCNDGVIEAIEDPDLQFCLGVQWHPEFLVTDLDHRIIEAFLKSCKASQKEPRESLDKQQDKTLNETMAS